jgi:putative hemolysin
MIGMSTLGGAMVPGLKVYVLLAVLLACSFFFSGSETALFSLQKMDRRALARNGRAGRQATQLLQRKQSLITSILMGNETANVALATMTAALIASAWDGYGWVNILILTPVLVLFSEITPKVLAFRFNREWSQLAAWPLTVFFVIFSPLRWVLNVAVIGIARLFGAGPSDAPDDMEEEELLVYLDQGAEAGTVAALERDFVEAVFELDDLTIERVMTPRPDIFALPLNTPWRDLVLRCRESGFSRIPLYNKTPDSLVGVLLFKDLLKLRHAPVEGPLQLRSVLIPPVFVPTSKRADTMLEEFLDRRFHMAYVVDEHGTLVGLVTLDDLLNELIGEVDGHVDIQEHPALPGDVMRVRATMDVEDFREETEIDLPAGEYHTLGGFVFHELGRLPRVGDQVLACDRAFVVSSMRGRRIDELHVHPQGAGDRSPSDVGGDA